MEQWNTKIDLRGFCFAVPAAADVYLIVIHKKVYIKTKTVEADAVEKGLVSKSAFECDPEPQPCSSVAPRPPSSAGFIKVS